MRRVVLLLALIVLGALAVGPVQAAEEAAPADCGSKELTLLFWPQGNPTISSIPLYSQRWPSLLIYSGAGPPPSDASSPR